MKNLREDKILGFSAGFHDAAAALIDNHGNILFAGHSERYSKTKHDQLLSSRLLDNLTQYGQPTSLSFYERPWRKWLRQVYSGIKIWPVDPRSHLDRFQNLSITVNDHHLSHAAAGFQTSDFNEATVVVCDAVGEWESTSIWAAKYDDQGHARYKKLWSRSYPHSLGLFYSAITQRVGLQPLDEEYITMGMSAWGQPNYFDSMFDKFVLDSRELVFKENFNIGIDQSYLASAANEDIAASAQDLTEFLIARLMEKARDLNSSDNLVFMGGVALNCVANRNLGKWFDNIWIMPNPGDAGSSLGAAALQYGKKLNWQSAFLGYEIPGPYPVSELLDHLLTQKIVGVASGRAEFGPRALGNRSLLADPRGPEIKDQVNEIKRRQKFRPFAPVILEEFANQYFQMPKGFEQSRYMQVVAGCRDPISFPAICHVDNTSRVQTVPNDNSGIRQLLEQWFTLTGCPMLLNTSLNIRGEPMVNDVDDARRFENLYSVKVCS